MPTKHLSWAGSCLLTCCLGVAQTLAFSPDAGWLVGLGVMTSGLPAVTLWDVASGCTVATARTEAAMHGLAWRSAPGQAPEFVTICQVTPCPP